MTGARTFMVEFLQDTGRAAPHEQVYRTLIQFNHANPAVLPPILLQRGTVSHRLQPARSRGLGVAIQHGIATVAILVKRRFGCCEGTFVKQVVPNHQPPIENTAPKSVMLRLNWVAPLAVILAVVYGSLIPFDVDWSLLANMSQLAWPVLSRDWTTSEDLIVNVLVYVPIGLTVILAGRRTLLALMLRAVAALVAGLSVSLACEAMQTFLISRVGSWVDVGLNIAGATIGAMTGLGVVAVAPLVSRSIRRVFLARPVAMASVILTIGLFLFNLAPFDFVYQTNHLRDSYLHASWQLFGGSHAAGQSQIGVERFADFTAALWFAALAYLIAFSRVRNGWRIAPAVASAIKHCVVLIVVIELTELLTRTQRFEISTIALRCCLAVAGAWSSAFVTRRLTHSEIRIEPRPGIPTSVLFAVLAVQMGVLILWSLRHSSVEHLYNASPTIEWLPFVSLWRQSAVHALSDIVSRFVSIGALMVTMAIVFRRIGGLTTLPIASIAVFSLCIFSIAVRCLTVTAHLDVTEPLIALVSVLLVASFYSRAIAWVSPVGLARA